MQEELKGLKIGEEVALTQLAFIEYAKLGYEFEKKGIKYYCDGEEFFCESVKYKGVRLHIAQDWGLFNGFYGFTVSKVPTKEEPFKYPMYFKSKRNGIVVKFTGLDSGILMEGEQPYIEVGRMFNHWIKHNDIETWEHLPNYKEKETPIFKKLSKIELLHSCAVEGKTFKMAKHAEIFYCNEEKRMKLRIDNETDVKVGDNFFTNLEEEIEVLDE